MHLTGLSFIIKYRFYIIDNKECETMTEEKKTNTPETEEVAESRNFILNFIDEDIAEGGQFQGMTVHTRFPPEPNGYLHIGHCKALTIDFGTAERYNGLCNLRMDDTNPTKEDEEFVEAIKQDIHWLGFDWGDRFFFGSDYFEKDYEYAVELIKKGLAYVCELTPEQFKEFAANIDYFVFEPNIHDLNDLGWRYLAQHMDMLLPPELLKAIDPVPFGKYAMQEEQGHFTEHGYISLSGDEWNHERPAEPEKKPSIRERLEQGKKECAEKNKAQPHKEKSAPEL